MEDVESLGALSKSMLPIQQGVVDEQDNRAGGISMERKTLGENRNKSRKNTSGD